MTLKTSLVTAIVGSALVLGVPAAWGQSQPVSADAVERAVLARELSSRLDAKVYRDAFERTVVASRRGVGPYVDAHGRSTGQLSTVPQHRDAFERASANTGQQWRDALTMRSEALNRMYGLGSASIGDSHSRVTPVPGPSSVPIAGSGGKLDWPELGIGFGIGLVLALSLLLAMRYTRVRPLAH